MLGMSFATLVGIIDWLLSSCLYMLLSPSTWSWSNRSSKEETKFHKGIQHGEVAIVHNVISDYDFC